MDLASPEKFNLPYEKECINLHLLAKLADKIFLEIGKSIQSLEKNEDRQHNGRTVVISIVHAGRKFSLAECRVEYSIDARTQGQTKQAAWKGDISFLNSSGDSLFSSLVQRHNIEGVRKLIQWNICLHIPDKKGDYPIHWLAKADMSDALDSVCGMQFGQRKAINNKTPGHKSASKGHNDALLSFNSGAFATYEFNKEKDGVLNGTTWHFTPIFVALVKKHYSLVGDLLRLENEPRSLTATERTPKFRQVGLFELALELGCFFELMNHVPNSRIENFLDSHLLSYAERLGKNEEVDYLREIQALLNVKKINPQNANECLPPFFENYQKHLGLAKWILEQKAVYGRTLLDFLSFYPLEGDSEMMAQLVSIYREVGISIPRDVEERLNVTNNSSSGEPQNTPVIPAQNSPTIPDSNVEPVPDDLTRKISFVARFILKPPVDSRSRSDCSDNGSSVF